MPCHVGRVGLVRADEIAAAESTLGVESADVVSATTAVPPTHWVAADGHETQAALGGLHHPALVALTFRDGARRVLFVHCDVADGRTWPLGCTATQDFEDGPPGNGS